MTLASNFLESSSIEHFFRGNTVPSSSAYLAFYASSAGEDNTGQEITGSGYFSRPLLNFELPTIGTSSITSRVGITASEYLGVITDYAILDTSVTGSGNLLAYGTLTTPLTASSGSIITVESASITLSWSADITQKFGNMMIDHFFRGQGESATTLYLGLITASAGPNGIAGEMTQAGYSRQLVNVNVTSDGILSGSNTIDFTATENWDPVTGGVYFLSSTALTAAFAKDFTSPETLEAEDTLRFNPGNITIKID